MKKEYAILAVVIIALGLYLLLRDKDQTHFELPTPEKIESASIDRIVVKKGATVLDLKKKDDTWFIQPQDYPADATTVTNMINAGADLTLTALVSESANYERYDLSDDKKITVQLFAGGEKQREMDIGRAAPTFQHTFVKLADDKRVFHARGPLERTFDRTLEDLRDKTVLSFDRQSITGMTVEKDGKKIILTRKTVTDPKDPAATSEDKKETSETKEQWLDAASAEPVDQMAVERLLSSFSNLTCDGFLAEKQKSDFTQPKWVVTFESGEQSFGFKLYDKQGDMSAEQGLPAVSSASEYVFVLNESRRESFEKHVDKLLGIEPEPEAEQAPSSDKTS